MRERSVFLIAVFVCRIIVSGLKDSSVHELESINNAVCEEMLCPTRDSTIFLKVWGRMLKFLHDLYQLMDDGDSEAYEIAKYLIDKGGPSCLLKTMNTREVHEIYDLTYERTDFVYTVQTSTRSAYSLIEIKYNMTNFELYKKSLWFEGDNSTVRMNVTDQNINQFNVPEEDAFGGDEELKKQRIGCVPDFEAQ